MKFNCKSAVTTAAAALVIIGVLAMPGLAQMGPHHERNWGGTQSIFLNARCQTL